jgi:mRNA interferase MazF
MSAPRRGEVWLVGLDPTKGHEQAGVRPALILSVDAFNSSAAGRVSVAPHHLEGQAASDAHRDGAA